uniref:Uncharacterized protein n=1 Tax=Caenorhabditis japonica TaxID=281687 RepID=A0A8R1HMN5_CAEJA
MRNVSLPTGLKMLGEYGPVRMQIEMPYGERCGVRLGRCLLLIFLSPVSTKLRVGEERKESAGGREGSMQ